MHIDIHNHFIPKDCLDAVDSAGRHFGGDVVIERNETRPVKFQTPETVPIRRWDPESRIKDMDEMGVDVQILSARPALLDYELEPEVYLWFSCRVNDGIARTVKDYPNRFLGMATIPLRAPDIAITELDRAVNKLGLRGVEILSNINGRDLDSPELMPFYQEVEKLDVPVFIHPHHVAGIERMRKYHLGNLIGNPRDTTLAAAHIVFGGILEKFPGIKFCLAHAGGNVPYLRGRWEHGYKVRPECKINIQQTPSHYLPLFYFDTITHSMPALQYLVATVGADKVVMGTDYPADMADSAPVSHVRSLNIAEKDKQLILGGNAARLFKL